MVLFTHEDSGFFSRQRSVAMGQRGENAQPEITSLTPG